MRRGTIAIGLATATLTAATSTALAAPASAAKPAASPATAAAPGGALRDVSWCTPNKRTCLYRGKHGYYAGGTGPVGTIITLKGPGGRVLARARVQLDTGSGFGGAITSANRNGKFACNSSNVGCATYAH